MCLKKQCPLFSVNVIEDKPQEDQGQAEGGGVVTTKKVTTVSLTITTAPVPMSVDTTLDDYLLRRATVETPKSSSQPAAANSSSSRYSTRTESTSALSPSAALHATFS